MPIFGRGQRESATRIFAASDLHGSTRCFKKFLNAAEFYDASVLLLAGDLTGKMIIPLIARNGGYTSSFQGTEHMLTTESEVAAHEALIEDSGFYAYRASPDEITTFEGNRQEVDAIFHRLVRQRLEKWMWLADERLPKNGTRCYVIPGNDDYWDIDPVLRVSQHVTVVDGERVCLDDDHELIGLGVSNITPWHAPRDLSEEEIAHRLSELTGKLDSPRTAIYLIHVPPADTSLDMAAELDADLRPTNAGTKVIHVGSHAVRECIEQTRPMLTIHGHIHESRGMERIGPTTCINAGSEYGEGILRGCLVSVSGHSVKNHLFVSG